MAANRKPFTVIPQPELQAAYYKALDDQTRLHDRILGMRAELVARQEIAETKAKLEALQAASDADVAKGG